ncbi:MAG: DUF6458 family protein [Nocardioidaceae bacterium]
MGAGIFLVVVGAILTFGVQDGVPNVDLDVVGVILMIAGAAVIAHARRGTRRERVVTRVDNTTDPTKPPQTVEHTVIDRDVVD